MIRTQISLDERAYREAKAEASRQGVSLAEFLRRAVAAALVGRHASERPNDLPRLRLLSLDAAHHSEVGRKLDRLRGYKLTYVDASSLVFLQARGIREV